MSYLQMAVTCMKHHSQIGLVCCFMLFCVGQGVASATEYQFNWKSELTEGSVGMCKIKVSGQPTVGASTTINSWEGVSLPFSSYTPQSLFAKFKYSPATGCAKLIIDAVCHIKPEGTEWIHKVEVTPCQNRTIGMHDNGMRQY